MDDVEQPVAHLGLPLAVAAAGGAAVVATMTRWWLCGPLNGVVAMVLSAAIGGFIGAALTNSLRCDPPDVTARKTFAFLAFAAPLTALVVTLMCDANQWGGDAMLLGLLFALVMLPGAFLALHVARTAQRSRERSLVGRSDRRAAWRTTALWLAVASLLGCVPATIDGRGEGYLADLFWWNAAEKADLAKAPLLVALAASFIAAVVALLDWRAERIVTRAREASREWRTDVSDHATSALDVGVGFAAWLEHLGGRATYRESPREHVAAIGDLHSGAAMLHKATRRSTIALAFVGAAELATLYVYFALTLAR